MKKKSAIWNPVFISVFVANFCMQMGQQMMNTLIPKYADSLGVAASMVGFISSAFSIAALVIRPFSGPASDSFSKKKLLIFAQLCVFFAFLAFSFVDNIYYLIAIRFLHGVGTGICTPLCLAMASNSLPDDRLGSGLGMFSLGHAVAQAIGPSIGLGLCSFVGYNHTFQIGAATMFVACVFSFYIKEPKDEVRPKFKIAINRIIAKSAIKPSIITFFLGASYSTLSFLAIYGSECGVEQIGLFFTAYAGTMVITRPVSGRLADRFGFDKVLIPGILFFSASFVLISLARSLPGFILAGVVGACGYGICQPTVQSICMRATPKNQRGAASNTNYIGMDCGIFLGPLVSGFVVDGMLASGASQVSAYSVMFLVMTIPMVLALVYFLIMKNQIKNDIRMLEVEISAEQMQGQD